VANLIAAITPVAVASSYTLTATNATLAVAAGSSATNTIAVSSTNLFSATIHLGCSLVFTGGGAASNVPNCAVAPASIAFPAASTATVTISSVAPHALLEPIGVSPFNKLPAVACALILCLLPLRRRRALSIYVLVASCALALSGCSSSGAIATTSTSGIVLTGGTTTGAYIVTISSSNTTDTTTPYTTFALNIQ